MDAPQRIAADEHWTGAEIKACCRLAASLDVASATGESLREIRRRGFSIADPVEPGFDPEPSLDAQLIDWDDYYGIEPPRHRTMRRKRRTPVAA